MLTRHRAIALLLIALILPTGCAREPESPALPTEARTTPVTIQTLPATETSPDTPVPLTEASTAPAATQTPPETPAAPTAPPQEAPAVEAPPPVAGLEGLSLDAFLDESFKLLMQRDPEWVAQEGLAERLGMRNDHLTDLSDAYTRETLRLAAGILEMLRSYERSALTAEQQISYDVYEWYLDDLQRREEFLYYDYPITHFVTGVQYQVIQLFTDIYPVANQQEAEDYVTCLSQVDDKFADLIEGLELRREAGVVLPRVLFPWLMGDIRSLAHGQARSTPFYTAFATKVRALGLAADEEKALLAAAETAIKESVIPAFAALEDTLDGLERVAPAEEGVGQFPRGEMYYEYALRHHTTTELSADEIHTMGQRELERVQAEIRAAFAELGYPAGESIPSLYERLARESGTVSGGKVAETYERILDSAEQRLDEAFDLRPQAELVVVAGSQGDYYLSAALDGSRPGAFYARVEGAGTPLFGMPTLAYHEGIPGHHMQIAIAQESELPLFRNVLTFLGYTEGWALYAEQLASELGWYDDDPYGNLGRLRDQAFRAARLVVDTGIHARGWSFEQAHEFMVDNVGRDPGMLQFEVSRYLAWPGQATAYMVGMLQIMELRQRAKEALGEQFDLKEFHHVLLSNGSMPLTVLERVVDDYIRTRQEGSGGSRNPAGDTYLGEAVPGAEPQPFRAGSVSTGAIEMGLAVHANLAEVYFTRMEGNRATIMVSREEAGGWTVPVAAPFSGEHDDMAPSLAPGGERLIFLSGRPLPGGDGPPEHPLPWYVDRQGVGWSEPEPLRLALEPEGRMGGFSLTADGSLYYQANHPTLGGEGLYVSRLAGGRYGTPERLDLFGGSDGSVVVEPFVTADESLLLFYSAGRPDNLAPDKMLGDLYVSFRDANGRWGEALNLGRPANSTAEEGTPSLSPDGKYLFFASNRGAESGGPDIYWMDAGFLRALGHAQQQAVRAAPVAPLASVAATLTDRSGPIYSLAWSPNGESVAAAGFGRVNVWDVRTSRQRDTLEGHEGFVWGVAWSPNGRTVASAGADGTVRLWPMGEAEVGAVPAATVLSSNGGAFCLAWSPDSTRLAAGTSRGTIHVWQVAAAGGERSAEEIYRANARAHLISIDWSPDGQALATGALDGRVDVWDANSGKHLRTFQDYDGQRCDANGVAWSPDSGQIASAHQDGVVRIWQAPSGAAGSAADEPALSLSRHAGWARGVAWSPDGQFLASTGSDRSVRLWDAASGEALAALHEHGTPVWSVDWSPDGTAIAAGEGVYDVGSTPSAVVVWQVQLAACQRQSSN